LKLKVSGVAFRLVRQVGTHDANAEAALPLLARFIMVFMLSSS
jgi:hypothetical protein